MSDPTLCLDPLQDRRTGGNLGGIGIGRRQRFIKSLATRHQALEFFPVQLAARRHHLEYVGGESLHVAQVGSAMIGVVHQAEQAFQVHVPPCSVLPRQCQMGAAAQAIMRVYLAFQHRQFLLRIGNRCRQILAPQFATAIIGDTAGCRASGAAGSLHGAIPDRLQHGRFALQLAQCF